jgi:hypothetical protein
MLRSQPGHVTDLLAAKDLGELPRQLPEHLGDARTIAAQSTFLGELRRLIDGGQAQCTRGLKDFEASRIQDGGRQHVECLSARTPRLLDLWHDPLAPFNHMDGALHAPRLRRLSRLS